MRSQETGGDAGDQALRVALWSPHPPPIGGISGWTETYLEAAPAAGIEAHPIDTAPPSSAIRAVSSFRLDRAAAAARALRRLEVTLRVARPHAAHLCTTLQWATPREAAALELCRLRGVPAVLHLRASTHLVAWHRGAAPAKRRAIDLVLRRASVLLTLSCELERYLREALPGAQVARIENPVDVARFHPAPRAPARAGELVVLYAGWIMPAKGLFELLSATRALTGVRVRLCGPRAASDDPGRDRALAAQIEALAGEGRLEYLGEVPPRAMPEVYRSADVFCLPSHAEGLPNTLLEAMASGLACVASAVGAVPEVAASADGPRALLVPPRDDRALREALRTLRDAPERRIELGAVARRHVAEHHDVPRVMERYRALYLSLRVQRVPPSASAAAPADEEPERS